MTYGRHPYDLGYVAGIIDGEGCIRSSGTRPVNVVVKMTDLDVLERCRSIVGVGKIHGPHRPSNGNKPLWTWVVGVREAVGLLMTIYPLMGVRRQGRIRESLLDWRSKPYRNIRYDGQSDDRRCGTYAGYGRHYRVGSRPCGPCAEAHNAYQRERRSR